MSNPNDKKPLTGAALDLWVRAIQAAAAKNRKFYEILYKPRDVK